MLKMKNVDPGPLIPASSRIDSNHLSCRYCLISLFIICKKLENINKIR